MQFFIAIIIQQGYKKCNIIYFVNIMFKSHKILQ